MEPAREPGKPVGHATPESGAALRGRREQPTLTRTVYRVRAYVLTAPFRAGQKRLRTLFRRFRRDPVGSAFDEILDGLAAAERVRDVSGDDIAAVARRWGVTLEGRMSSRTIAFYRDFLRHCLDDHKLTDDELADLDHLHRSLRLADDEVELAHRIVAREIYSRNVDEVLADANIDADERAFLSRLRETLGLSRNVAENIEAMKAIQRGARDTIPPKRSDLV